MRERGILSLSLHLFLLSTLLSPLPSPPLPLLPSPSSLLSPPLPFFSPLPFSSPPPLPSPSSLLSPSPFPSLFLPFSSPPFSSTCACTQLLKCLIHCADLNNPTKPEHLAAEWAHRVMEEAFLQGDNEKKLGIPVNPLGDRDQVCFEKCQVSVRACRHTHTHTHTHTLRRPLSLSQVTFIDFIVYPLWEIWAELVHPDAQDILENISKTREFWNSQLPNSPPPASSDSEDTPTERDQPATSPPPSIECSPTVRTDKLLSYPRGSFEAMMNSPDSPQASERRYAEENIQPGYIIPCLSHC